MWLMDGKKNLNTILQGLPGRQKLFLIGSVRVKRDCANGGLSELPSCLITLVMSHLDRQKVF